VNSVISVCARDGRVRTRRGSKRLLHNTIFKGVIRKDNNTSTNAKCGDRCSKRRAEGGELVVNRNAQCLKDARRWMNP
jgi:hypothetical protein